MAGEISVDGQTLVLKTPSGTQTWPAAQLYEPLLQP
jgi:hypothetical protein